MRGVKEMTILDKLVEERLLGIRRRTEEDPGEELVLYQYTSAKRLYKVDRFVLLEIVWGSEMEDFLKALDKLEVKEMIVTLSSSGLMDTLAMLVEGGWNIDGMGKLEHVRGDLPWNNPVNGILMSKK